MTFHEETEKIFCSKLMNLKNHLQNCPVLKLNPKFRGSSLPVTSAYIHSDLHS